MLTGKFAKQGYDWWWHSFTAKHEETGEERPFFIEYFVCNPALAQDTPVFGQLPENEEGHTWRNRRICLAQKAVCQTCRNPDKMA